MNITLHVQTRVLPLIIVNNGRNEDAYLVRVIINSSNIEIHCVYFVHERISLLYVIIYNLENVREKDFETGRCADEVLRKKRIMIVNYNVIMENCKFSNVFKEAM
ncbi:uncharacterized protein LOC133667438 [Apis cerana]|uniref:uncharacterized protein LOC133667438 n=1 Tax=Apis cerana TaxID=7461 RepID=UPI002B2230D6|nr:uncharacterized protein LOC133667438 [Apis cerana]